MRETCLQMQVIQYGTNLLWCSCTELSCLIGLSGAKRVLACIRTSGKDIPSHALQSSHSFLFSGSLTFSNYITKTFDEMLCCPNGYPVCCPKNTCCPSQYPVCCPPNYCCASGARCVSGQCVREDGTIAPGVQTGKRTTASVHEGKVEV